MSSQVTPELKAQEHNAPPALTHSPNDNENSRRHAPEHDRSEVACEPTASSPFKGLSILDKLLALLVLLAMIIGVVIGKFANGVESVLKGASLQGVSIPIMIGLLVMMWPILTKVRYEKFPAIFRERYLWKQIAISLFLNWIIGPFVMLGVAWATLPDLPTYRTGVIIVGIARCIAMVMIWNQLAGGNSDLCAILVIINSILQLVLFSPMMLLFCEVIFDDNSVTELYYGPTAIAVLIYLGIPLVAGIITRALTLGLFGRKFFDRFMVFFGPVALLGLLYTIILICAEQATRILDNIGNVFRVFVPLVLYFTIMWAGTFFTLYYLARRSNDSATANYQSAVVQSFTAGSNNFELAIAVCVAIYGVDSDQALAATIGPLVEVPVLLCLSYLSLWLRHSLNWAPRDKAGAARRVTADTV